MKRPDTYDIWEFVRFCLEHGDKYYVKVPRPNPANEAQMIQTLVPLCNLNPQEWTYWVRTWFYTASTGVMTLEEWVLISPAPIPDVPAFSG